jgi:predicted phage terminase large subunit-like protein
VTAVELTLPELYAERERRERSESLAEEAERLSGSLAEFIKAAWRVRSPKALIPGWHIDAVSDHVQAAFDHEIRKLAINIPPRTLKSEIVSVFAPAWEWTRQPETRFLTCSYVDKLATDFSVGSRDLIRSGWYQARWGSRFQMKSDADLKTRYFNDQGGHRIATSVGGSATGSGGDIIIVDDPHNTEEVESENAREAVIDWHDGTLSTRFNDPETGVEILIMQRVHERDLTGHVLDLDPGEWTLLCLPEEFETKHPHRYPKESVLPSGRVVRGDPREDEGELLHPARIGPAAHAERKRRLGEYRAAGQLQQRPSAHEGAILKRTYWRYFDPTLLDDDRVHLLPKFQAVISSWDTSYKDKTSSDYVAGGTWGILGGDRYLLRITVDRMNLTAAKTAMLEHRAWALQRWPNVPYRALIEKSANGVEIIEQLQREVPGIQPVVASKDKTTRAFAASPDIESGNVFLPGHPSPEASGYDESRTPTRVQELVEQCAKFPAAAHDDIVDMVTQLLNWTRVNLVAAARTESAVGRRIGKPERLQRMGG